MLTRWSPRPRCSPPADIEFAARKGAQFGFEREIEFRRDEAAQTSDYLRAISETRPSLTQAELTEFGEDTELYTRGCDPRGVA